NGRPAVCVPDPHLGRCVRPFHDPSLINDGGPHSDPAARSDINDGKMNGFIRMSVSGARVSCAKLTLNPVCTGRAWNNTRPDVMGWHDSREIPNYWAYAEHY